MPAPSIQVKGAKELRSAIRRAGDVDLRDQLKAANSEAADVVAYEAQTIVPVKTGRLLETIRASGTQAAGIVRSGKQAVPYAGIVHFGRYFSGTGTRQEPNPFLYDAADARVDEVLAKYEEAIAVVVDRVNQSGAQS